MAAATEEELEECKGEEEYVVCAVCGSMPCEWIEFGKEALEKADMTYNTNEDGNKVDDDDVPVANARMRKALYRLFTYMKFGHLGRGNRIPIPPCVVDKFREAYPEPDGVYMGFHEE